MESDTGAIGELAELERKIAEFRAAHAQTIVERDESVRNAERAAKVLSGLVQLQREFGAFAAERSHAREVASRDLAAAVAADAGAVEADEDARRTAAEIRAKLDSAAAESAAADERTKRCTDFGAHLQQQALLCEARLTEARTSQEAVRLEADLKRISDLELRLSSERGDLERRLRDLRSSQAGAIGASCERRSEQDIRAAASDAMTSLLERSAAATRTEPQPIVSLRMRLERDLGGSRA